MSDKPKISLKSEETENDNVEFLSSDEEVNISKPLKDTDIDFTSTPTTTVWKAQNQKKKNRFLQKTRGHPYSLKNESLRTKRVDLSNSKIRQQINSAKREKQFNKVLNDVENDVIFTKYVSPDVEFIKQVPLDPRERFKRNLTAKLKKVTTPLHPRERLKQKVAKLEDELKFI